MIKSIPLTEIVLLPVGVAVSIVKFSVDVQIITIRKQQYLCSIPYSDNNEIRMNKNHIIAGEHMQCGPILH